MFADHSTTVDGPYLFYISGREDGTAIPNMLFVVAVTFVGDSFMVCVALVLHWYRFWDSMLNSVYRHIGCSPCGAAAGNLSSFLLRSSWGPWASVPSHSTTMRLPDPPNQLRLTVSVVLLMLEAHVSGLPLAQALYIDKVNALMTTYLALVLATNIATVGRLAAPSMIVHAAYR